MIESWSAAQLEAFERDGFLLVEEAFIDAEAIELLRAGFGRLFAGEYESGIRPDEVNWVAGRDPEDRTRQICNGWKAEAGTITYAAGSHRWPCAPKNRGEFHAPADWLAPVGRAAPDGEEPRLVPIEVKAGGASFHHHLTFHGSGPNTASVHRRAVISHLIPADAEFHPANVDPTYSRYRRVADPTLDESFFPVVWTRDGRRSAWLDAELSQNLAGVLAEGGNRS